ncbi:MAG: CpsB/CapC family capsule biosynthesis tyrosine phosphatase, partial [Ruminococcus sp.]
MTDSHIHILPGIDDGSKNAGMSAAMANKLKNSGIER